MLECANFLHERGHETHVFATDWDVASMRPGIVRHPVPVAFRPSFFGLLGFAKNVRRELRRSRVTPEGLGTFGVQSPPGGVMWVQSVHRAWLDICRENRDFRGRLKQRLNPIHPVTVALERYHFGGRRYKKLIALTPEVRGDLIRLYGVPADDIVTIPNGFSRTEFNVPMRRQLRAAMRKKLGCADDEKVVVFVANELERKGFAPLLRAIVSLNDPRLRLLAVGRLNPNTYANEIERSGMSGRVRFTGPSSEVATFYAASDVFALPTQYEAWGLVIVEAMACGLPVLTSRLAGAAVAVREGETGELLDDPRDVREIASKLSLLVGGRHLSDEKIAESVSEYAWDCVLLRYEEVLLESFQVNGAAREAKSELVGQGNA